MVIQRGSHNTGQKLSDAHFTSKPGIIGKDCNWTITRVDDNRQVLNTQEYSWLLRPDKLWVQLSKCNDVQYISKYYAFLCTYWSSSWMSTASQNQNSLCSLYKFRTRKKENHIVLCWMKYTGQWNSAREVDSISGSVFWTLPYHCLKLDSTLTPLRLTSLLWQAWKYCTTCTASGSLSASVCATLLC